MHMSLTSGLSWPGLGFVDGGRERPTGRSCFRVLANKKRLQKGEAIISALPVDDVAGDVAQGLGRIAPFRQAVDRLLMQLIGAAPGLGQA